ncbi:MAG TPA: FTR1 family protein [Gemmatimonadaceae bacterium]|nr:FTR1 family protein [Gemmatimonadaceae bacterium]
MHLRTVLICLAAVAIGEGAHPAFAQAQELPARRLSSIVGVAVEEYAKGVDESGRLTSADEYGEARDFLVDARDVARRLSSDRAATVRAVLDTLIAAVAARQPPSELRPIRDRLLAALGAEGALELPRHALDTTAGRVLYAARCASCHGATGKGDGPMAASMDPRPPAIGDADTMRDASPALLYRVISVGVSGTPMPAWAGTLTPEQRWNIVAYLQSLHSTPQARLEGEGLFLQRCAGCHGALGGGGGGVADALTHLPPDIASLAWQAERSDAQLAEVVRHGLPGTAMPPSADLNDAEVAKVVAFVRSLPLRAGQLTGAVASSAANDSTPEGTAHRVLGQLDGALAAARSGRLSDAGDRAFDSYIAFEPLETRARARSPGLVATMERHFADFKAAIRRGDLRSATQSRDAIEAGLPAIVDLTRPTAGPMAAFLQSLLIILREGFEAILVLGAVVAFLLKTGHRERLSSIWTGAGLGLAASAATAVVLKTALAAMPASREIIEGVTLLVAVVVLFSVSYWLISRAEAARWQQFIREKVDAALTHGGSRALAFVAFLAVYREGAETALFYQALFAEGTHLVLPLSLGIIVGFVLLAIVFTLFYRFGVRIPLRPFFTTTSLLLYYLAFVFMGKGIRELQEGNAISMTLIPGFPRIEALGIYNTVESVLAQVILLALFVFAVAKTFWPKRSVALPTAGPVVVDVADLSHRVANLQDTVTRVETRLTALERETVDPQVTRHSGADES